MNLKPLLLPVTVRTAKKSEIPLTEDLMERLRLREQALLVEGFSFFDTRDAALSYHFFSEINIDNPNLWLLFKRLTMMLPEEVCLIFQHIDNEPSYSQYLDKFEILNKLDEYQQELSMDGYMEFGLMFQDDDCLVEIFVKRTKYIQFWGKNEALFRKAMQDLALTEIPGINFIDEYPLVTEALSLHHPELMNTSDLLKALAYIS